MKAILFLLLTVHAPSLVWGMGPQQQHPNDELGERNIPQLEAELKKARENHKALIDFATNITNKNSQYGTEKKFDITLNEKNYQFKKEKSTTDKQKLIIKISDDGESWRDLDAAEEKKIKAEAQQAIKDAHNQMIGLFKALSEARKKDSSKSGENALEKRSQENPSEVDGKIEKFMLLPSIERGRVILKELNELEAKGQNKEEELIKKVKEYLPRIASFIYDYKAKYQEFKKAIESKENRSITLENIKLTVENEVIKVNNLQVDFDSIHQLFKGTIAHLEDLYKEILDLDPRRTRKLSRKEALALIQEHLDNALGNLRRRREVFDEVSRENPQGKIEINIGPNEVVERKDDDLSESYLKPMKKSLFP